jgi:hypothetical protein
MVNQYVITYKDPATGNVDTTTIERLGQPHPSEVGQWVLENGIKTDEFWIPGEYLVKVERDTTPDPVAEPVDAPVPAEVGTVPIVSETPPDPIPNTQAAQVVDAPAVGVTPEDPAANQ